MPRFRTSDGISLHYTDTGSGAPALLCLPGLTRTGADFDYVAPYLEGCRLIRLDYRGRGASDWAAPESYTIPVEARDSLELLDHLELDRAAILGTSRGGLIAMTIAATARDRLVGICLNDIGPVIDPAGLAAIAGYLGRHPEQRTLAEAAAARPALMPGFRDVPPERWADEVARHYRETPEGLRITYDPRLRDAVAAAGAAAGAAPAPDLWPLFDAMAGLPLALIRGAASDILSAETVAEMRRRRPDMIYAEVPGRGHIPFLDEPEAVAALRAWLEVL